MAHINIVLAADSNYMPYLETTLKSLFMHNKDLDVFILNSGDIESSWARNINQYLLKRNSKIHLVNIDVSLLTHFNTSHYISSATYLRFYMWELCQFSESPYWIYLDCDIVINGDVTQPFTLMDFSSYSLAAVSDPYVNSLSSHTFKDKDYFNAGVFYYQVKPNSQTEGICEKLMTLGENLKDRLVYGDQDILNVYFKDNWFLLDKKYNFQLDHLLQDFHQKQIPSIIHFTGPVKPLSPIHTENEKVMRVVMLFRLYQKLSWEEICHFPLGTIKLEI